MQNAWKYALGTIGFLCSCVLSCAQTIPATQAKALDGSSVNFPRNDSPKPLLFVIGFSHKSANQCKSWSQRLKPIYARDPRIAYYELADFQGVPSFVMWMILHGMRREVPKDDWPHFVPLYTDEEKWKKLAGYSAPDHAYLIVADPSGRVLWQAHGPPSDANYGELQAVLGKQITKP